MSIRMLFKDRGVHLTPLQAKLIHVLKGRNRPVAYGTILESLYGFKPSGDYPQDEVLKVAASTARKKIQKAGFPWKIVCTYGFGYELDEGKTTKTLRRAAVGLGLTLALTHPLLGRLLG